MRLETIAQSILRRYNNIPFIVQCKGGMFAAYLAEQTDKPVMVCRYDKRRQLDYFRLSLDWFPVVQYVFSDGSEIHAANYGDEIVLTLE